MTDRAVVTAEILTLLRPWTPRLTRDAAYLAWLERQPPGRLSMILHQTRMMLPAPSRVLGPKATKLPKAA